METSPVLARLALLQEKIQSGQVLQRSDWLWMVAASLSVAETRQDQGYAPAHSTSSLAYPPASKSIPDSKSSKG